MMLRDVLFLCSLFLPAGCAVAVELPLPELDTGAQTAEGQADTYTLDVDSRILTATGRVRLNYGGMRLLADRVRMDLGHNTIQAIGHVTVRRPEVHGEQVLRGEDFSYDYERRTGRLDAAEVYLPPLIFKGRTLRLTGQGLIIRDASFTACDRPHPHYRLTTDCIEIIPGDKATARHATVWWGNRRIFRLNRFSTSLKKDKKRKSRMLLPTTLVNGTDLLLLETTQDLRLFPPASGKKATLKLGASVKQGFRGGLDLTHRTPHFRATFSLARKSAGADPLDSKIMLNRMPELSFEARDYPLGTRRLRGEAQLSLGRLREFPSKRKSTRRYARIGVSTTVPFPHSPTTALVTQLYYRWSSYDAGLKYEVLGLDVSVHGALGSKLSGEIGYVTHNIHGRTPFEFDDVDLGRELRVSGDWQIRPRWRIPFRLRYDLDAQTWGNREVGLVRQGHCLEYGFTWDQARSELGLVVGFVGL